MSIDINEHSEVINFNTSSETSIYAKINDFITDIENEPKPVASGLPKEFKLRGFTIISASPGAGKTAIAIYSTIQAAKSGQNVLFYSFEMPAYKVFIRMLMNYYEKTDSEIYEIIRQIKDNQIPLPDLFKYIHLVDNKNFMSFNERGEAVFDAFKYKEIIDKLDALKNDKPQLVVVDSLTEIPKSEGSDERGEINKALTNLYAISLKTKAAVLLIAQADKESLKNNNMNLSSFRGSAAIQYTADNLILLQKDIEGENYIFNVVKQRYDKSPLSFEYQFIKEIQKINFNDNKENNNLPF